MNLFKTSRGLCLFSLLTLSCLSLASDWDHSVINFTCDNQDNLKLELVTADTYVLKSQQFGQLNPVDCNSPSVQHRRTRNENLCLINDQALFLMSKGSNNGTIWPLDQNSDKRPGWCFSGRF